MKKKESEQENNLMSIIQQELDSFGEDITIDTGWSWNQKKQVTQNNLYFNSKFVDGDMDEDGLKLYFYNIMRAACGTTTKAIDIDTKDILLLTAEGGNSLKTWFYQRDLKNWMKKKEFGKILNRISEELPIQGTCVLKYVNGEVKFVNLKNFIVEQNADSLDKSNFIIEEHYYTPLEFKKIGEDMEWDNIEKVVKDFRELNSKNSTESSQYIRVFERYGEYYNEDSEEYEYGVCYVADIPNDVKNSPNANVETAGNDYVLGMTKLDKHPYIEFHINKISGRWLGVGVCETLTENQLRLNELINQGVKSSYWSFLRLFQTKDTGVARNLLQDCENGDVLNPEDPITQIDMTDRNLSHSQFEIPLWEQNGQKQTFATDIMMGGRTPAGTPLGSAQLSVSMSMSYFDQMKENIALQLKYLLYNYILPDFAKYANKAHIIKIFGEDIDKMREMIIDTHSRKKFFEFIIKNGRIPDPEFMEMVKEVDREALSKKAELMVGTETGWFDDVMYYIDIVITGESIDIATKASNILQAFQILQQDPTVLQDPTKKKIFAAYLEKGGLNLADIEANTPKASVVEQPTQMAGGGISAPSAQTTGLTQTQMTV